MKFITLYGGARAKVDDEDYESLILENWKLNDFGYAWRLKWTDGKVKVIFMHRVVNKTPEGLFTDHINRDKLDNRKINLRDCTKSQNRMNSKLSRNNKSGMNGVFFTQGKWRAQIYLNNKQIGLGSFTTLEEAKAARLEGERTYWYK